jgi:hypothetical protein
VRLHSDNRDLRGPEVELHAVETVMACDVVVAGPSLTLEDDYNAKR